MTGISQVLAATVYIDGANRPFGEVTLAQAKGRADELRSAIGFGPTVRVMPVAQAWRELTMVMERAGVGTVAELDSNQLLELAPKLWVVPPGGTLL